MSTLLVIGVGLLSSVDCANAEVPKVIIKITITNGCRFVINTPLPILNAGQPYAVLIGNHKKQLSRSCGDQL